MSKTDLRGVGLANVGDGHSVHPAVLPAPRGEIAHVLHDLFVQNRSKQARLVNTSIIAISYPGILLRQRQAGLLRSLRRGLVHLLHGGLAGLAIQILLQTVLFRHRPQIPETIF